MSAGLWNFIEILLIYAVLFGSLFFVLYFLEWAFSGLIGAFVRFMASMFRRLKGPAARELENVRTKKDIAKINICVLNAQERVLEKVCKSKSNYRGR